MTVGTTSLYRKVFEKRTMIVTYINQVINKAVYPTVSACGWAGASGQLKSALLSALIAQKSEVITIGRTNRHSDVYSRVNATKNYQKVTFLKKKVIIIEK